MALYECVVVSIVYGGGGREGRGAAEDYIVLRLHVSSFINENLRHFGVTMPSGVEQSGPLHMLWETDTHSERERPRDRWYHTPHRERYRHIHAQPGKEGEGHAIHTYIHIWQCTTQCFARERPSRIYTSTHTYTYMNTSIHTVHTYRLFCTCILQAEHLWTHTCIHAYIHTRINTG